MKSCASVLRMRVKEVICTDHEAASFLSQQLPGIEYGGGMVDCRGKTSYYFDCDATTIRSVALICAN